MGKVLATTSLIVLLAAGCGGGQEEPAPATGEETPAAGEMPVALSGEVNNEGTERVSGSASALDLEADDFYFEPTFVQADPDANVSVTIENEGEAEHTFTIDSLGVDEEVAPGDEVTVEVTVPEDQAVRYYCRFHEGQGMIGAFYTEEGQTVAD